MTAPFNLLFNPYILGFSFLAMCGVCLKLYFQTKKVNLEKQDLRQQYKLEINKQEVLRDIFEKYSQTLDLQKMIDDTIADLSKVVRCTSFSYILNDGNGFNKRTHLNESVSPRYVESLDRAILESLKGLHAESFIATPIKKSDVTGALQDESRASIVTDYINIPLEIAGQLVGLINLSLATDLFARDDYLLIYSLMRRATGTLTGIHDLIEHEKGRLRAMVESMHDGVLMFDADMSLMSFNPSCLRYLGISKNFNIDIFDIVSAFSKKFEIADEVSKVLKSGEEISFTDIQIEQKYFHILLFPIKVRNKVIGVGVLIHDQTKEMELKKLQDEFTAMMIHELRSPLSVIKGSSDLILTDGDKIEKSQTTELITMIRSSSDGLLTIVNDLLDISKIESNKIELFKKPADLNKLLEEEKDYYGVLAKESGLTLVTEISKSDLSLSFDYAKMKQVVNNLISNGIKFTTEGSITLKSWKDDKFAYVSIADTGPGIPDEMKAKLFEKFVQVRDTATTGMHQKGTGLGLVISKGIVEAHGGKIWIEDNAPHGTKFVFNLPLSES